MKYCPQCQHTYASEKNYCLRDGTKLLHQDPYHLTGRTLVDKFQIIELAGLGGLGAVYKARQLGIDRQVAFKILQPNVVNQLTVSLFEREAKMAGGLSHENIVTVYDSGRTAEGISYIAMEWLEGTSLKDELAKTGQLDLKRIAELLKQITAALEVAHKNHIIHRDLKPDNIMLVKRSDGSEQVKVVDFGIGKVLSDTAGSAVSTLAGTAQYAAPEQFQAGAKIDQRADIYSLGVMLFEMLTNKLPFDGSSNQAIIQMHREASPPRMQKFRANIPAGIELLVEDMLSKKPENRPRTAEKVRKRFSSEALSQIDKMTVRNKSNDNQASSIIRFNWDDSYLRYTRQMKILLVGTSAVGKTSLVSRFVKSVFSDKYHTTVGVKIDRKTVTIGNAEITLMIWDLHGEDVFQKLRVPYLKGGRGYFFVADGTRRSTLEATLTLQQTVKRGIEILDEEVRKSCEERGDPYEERRAWPPFMLLLNKADLNDDWEIEQSEIEALETRGWTVMKTSAKTGMGVEEAFLKLTALILEQEFS